MKKALFIIVMLVLLFPLVKAEPSYIFEQGTNADIKASCTNETSGLCDSSTPCTLTIIKPDSTILIENRTMTHGTTYYNYTINSTQTEDLGEYTSIVVCYGSSTNGFGSFTYLITRTGKTLDTSDSVGYFLLSLMVLFLFLLSLYFAIKIPYKNPTDNSGQIRKVTKYKYFKILFIVITYNLMLWFLNLLVAFTTNYLDLAQYLGFVTFLFNVMLRMLWVFIVIVLIWCVYLLVKDSNLKKELKRFRSLGNGQR